MAHPEPRYAITDLARQADATARTIRYYVAQGLLPAPTGTGPGAHYTNDHLARLRLIRRLQRQHQPLAEIRARLTQLDSGEVAALVADAPVDPPSDSALDYVRSLLAAAPGSARPRQIAAAPALSPAAAPVPASAPLVAPAPPAARAMAGLAGIARRGTPPTPAAHDLPMRLAEAPDDPAGNDVRSQWDRIGLTPNIEIHVRRPLSRLENRRVERLITIARQILREEQP